MFVRKKKYYDLVQRNSDLLRLNGELLAQLESVQQTNTELLEELKDTHNMNKKLLKMMTDAVKEAKKRQALEENRND